MGLIPTGLIYGCVLLLNALCILDQDRFLKTFGLKHDPEARGPRTLRSTVAARLYGIQMLRGDILAILNAATIVLTVVFG